jgi:hypothetical protein
MAPSISARLSPHYPCIDTACLTRAPLNSLAWQLGCKCTDVNKQGAMWDWIHSTTIPAEARSMKQLTLFVCATPSHVMTMHQYPGHEPPRTYAARRLAMQSDDALVAQVNTR